MDDSGSPTQTSNRVTDIPSTTGEEKQVSEETQGKPEETVVQGSQQPAAISEKMSVSENENVKEATPKKNTNELNVSDAGHAVSDTADVTSISVNTFVAKKDEEMEHDVLQQTAVTETKAGSEENPSTSQDDHNNRIESGGTGSNNTVEVPNRDSKLGADSGLPTNSPDQEKGLVKKIPVLNERNDDSAQSDKIVEDLRTVTKTENVSLEEHEQKLGKQEEKEKCHKSDLKMENRETNKDSDISDTGEESNVSKITKEKFQTKTPGNKQKTAEKNSHDGSAAKLNEQGNLDKKIKEDESIAQMIARSTAAKSQTNAKVCFATPNCERLTTKLQAGNGRNNNVL